MTQRCKHEIEIKTDYPDDLICRKCGGIWKVSKYVNCNSIELFKLPKEVRFHILCEQAERFANDFLAENPDYYTE